MVLDIAVKLYIGKDRTGVIDKNMAEQLTFKKWQIARKVSFTAPWQGID